MIALLLAAAAFATSGFVPDAPQATFDGTETFTQDGATKLWSEVTRWSDPDTALFDVGEYNTATEWQDTDTTPWIATMFGTARPRTSAFLLHAGPSEQVAHGTPILFVCGAGDNASRGFVVMATHEDRLQRPVYAVTFAQAQGDVFRQAEVVADALAVLEARTGAPRVDVVAHSKGGVAAVVYASNESGTDWGDTATATAYASVGTPYRGDIRRLVLLATPLGGIDTAYRWPANNLFGLTEDTAIAPVSWNTYYPQSTSAPWDANDLRGQDFLPDHGDLFPGQRQILHRQDAPLPWTEPWLRGYATSQVDNQTTYEGGLGFYSDSDGIDAAVEAGGGLIDRLATLGVDPSIAVYLLAGTNPLMPNADDALAKTWSDLGIRADQWSSLLADITSHGVPVSANADELDGLKRGKLLLGEVTAISDGLVFRSSALDADAVTARGASVQVATVNLSHLDLLYASPITGQALIDAADAGTDANAWERGVGKRYISEDSIGTVETWIADEPQDTGTTDTGAVDTGADTGGPPPMERPCGGCTSAPGGGIDVAGLLLTIALLGWRRRWRP